MKNLNYRGFSFFCIGVFCIGGFLAFGSITPAAACRCAPLIQMHGNQVTSAINAASAAEIKHSTNVVSDQTRTIVSELKQLGEIMKHYQAQMVASTKAAEKGIIDHSTERTYEPSSMPETNCGNDSMSGSLQSSVGVTNQTAEDMMKKLYERKKRYPLPVDYRKELLQDDRPKYDEVVELMGALNPGKTMTVEETAKNVRVLEAITEPIPLAELPQGAEKTSAGQNYQYKKETFETMRALYQGVVARYLAERSPSLENMSEWAVGKWGDMGGDGDPPGLVDGKMSYDAWRTFMARMRITSANWHEEILPTLPEAGLLRDMAAMQAFSLELQRKEIELLEKISMMMALEGSQRLEKNYRLEISNAYEQAIAGERK